MHGTSREYRPTGGITLKTEPYDHEHVGVEEIPWSRLGGILIQLAEDIRRDWEPEIVVGIAKGGVIPAVFLSSVFQVDFFPIKLSSRHNEEVVRKEPKWFVFPTENVRDKKVLLVDDIVVAERTLCMAKERIEQFGPKEIRTATIAVHGVSVAPDYFALLTNALIIWPWDRDNLTDKGKWFVSPEYMAEMEKIPGYVPGPSPAREPEGQWLK